jgi:hypothetical protein
MGAAPPRGRVLDGGGEHRLDPIARDEPGPGQRRDEQVRGARDPLAMGGDDRVPVGHPRVDDVLARFALQLAEHGVGRHGHPGQHGLYVGVDQISELVAVATAENADLDRWHATSRVVDEADAATGAVPGRRSRAACASRADYRGVVVSAARSSLRP